MTRAGLAPGDIGNVAYVTKDSGVILARVRFRREDGSGGRVSRTGPSRAAARRAVMEAAREQMKDFELDAELTLNRDSTLAELVEAYLAVQDERNETGTRQYLNDEAAVARKYIAQKDFGATTLRKLRPSLIVAEHRRIKRKRPGRARQFATVIRKLCAYAYELDLVTSNPALGIKLTRS
ncbi:hypothetical protein R8Z57_07485 [Microbacterium sp. M3]|uniref:Core-binding (CB) domain-containing protein n=1 Tax=Microbacterium arthrosphaerae TaxID=792652 RepID=A0ABU4H1J8_9MICO|nr:MULTISPECIES: hypothetical protein [Microbacterium]MDW4572617.1 hypothetical protein [Microbacterium arthrosphaerae]MDW7606472.1 hypothetical protein [Microbacterium sp. M3]